MMTEQEKFEKVLHNCILETQCMLQYDEDTTRDIAWFIWQACATEKDKKIAELEAKLAVAIKALKGANYAIKGREHTGFIDEALTEIRSE